MDSYKPPAPARERVKPGAPILFYTQVGVGVVNAKALKGVGNTAKKEEECGDD